MEVIVAIGIMIMGIVSILILTSYNLASAEYGANRLIASNLARESLDVIRNIRDSNWLDPTKDWDNGLPSNPATDKYRQIVKFTENDTYGSYALEGVEEIDTCSSCKLYVKDTIFSHDDTGTDSGFRRQIEFESICNEVPSNKDGIFLIMSISQECTGGYERVGFVLTARVQWQASNGDTREVAIEDRVFDWR